MAAPGLIERQFLRARNGLAYVTGANRPVMGQTPRDLVWKRDKACLWRYRSDDGARPRYRPPVLIVHSLVSKSYVLDLLPHTSMLRYLVGEGFDMFLLDWEPPDPADGENTLETYIDEYIPEAIGVVMQEGDAREVTLIGYCFGGVLTLLTAAAHPELPIRGMMVMAAPCDYREMGFMSNMFRQGRLDADDVIDDTGLVPAQALDEGFQSLKPTEIVVQRVNFFENLWNDDFVEGFLAIAHSCARCAFPPRSVSPVTSPIRRCAVSCSRRRGRRACSRRTRPGSSAGWGSTSVAGAPSFRRPAIRCSARRHSTARRPTRATCTCWRWWAATSRRSGTCGRSCRARSGRALR
jgi:pimeloyl-ACP methyl ester carboxylesterase